MIKHDKEILFNNHLQQQDAITNCNLKRWHQHTERFITRTNGTQPKPVPYVVEKKHGYNP